MDAERPPAGHPSEHVADLGLDAASDSAVWERAACTGAVIVTKDQDFAVLRIMSDAPTPSVVWLRIGNSRRAALLRWFEPLLPSLLLALSDGSRLVEVE